jgi:nicotinate-nucleotide--dimethylbenzimidazole phosphoribosyltransferase
MQQLIFSLPPLDLAAQTAAIARQSRLTKPPGSLGRLEELVIQMAAFQRAPTPRARPAEVVLFAADHPVTRHGVSPYPSEVTRAMVMNFASGGAAASVLARKLGLPLTVVDVGVLGGEDIFVGPTLARRSTAGVLVYRDDAASVRAGDIRTEDGLNPDDFARSVGAGIAAIDRLPADTRVVLLGEMGIGNTTPAAAVCAALIGGDAGLFVGAGTGTSGAALERKREVVRDAVARLEGNREPLEALRRVGGRELCALFGAMHRALATGRIVLVDGFIVSAAALVLLTLAPEASAGLVFAHRSDEQAHGRVLEHLGARPLLDLGLRLGEASGALTAFSLLDHACALHAEMATFESAAVPDRESAE